MKAKPEDLSMLLKLQSTDTDIIRTKKELAGLPQVAKLTELAKKHAALDSKREQVDALKKKVETEVTRLSTEDEMLADKQRHAQELIDNAGADYRSVESHSKEMSGFAKRRKTLDEKLSSLADELGKIEGVQSQIAAAIAAVSADEEKLKAAYVKSATELKSSLAEMSQVREAQAGELPKELLDLYQETARHTGGVAVGKLDENKCGVCRTPIADGRLTELKKNAPLGTCPNCRRLLIVS